jgi:hypothetical protein
VVVIFHFLNSILRGCTHLSEALKNQVELHQKADYLDSILSEGGLFGWCHLIEHGRIKLVKLRSRLEVWVFRTPLLKIYCIASSSVACIEFEVCQDESFATVCY